MTLVLLPGNHSLNVSIQMGNLSEFRMETSTLGSYTDIVCTESANLYLHHIDEVYISGVKFVGCEGSRFESVNQVSLENVTYTSCSGSALELTGVVSAHITGSFFISNREGTHRSDTEFLEYVESNSEDPNHHNIDTQANIGGAMIITRSNVYITACLFKANRAQVGGAIYSEKYSNVTIRRSNFTQNHAERSDIPNPGGVMVLNSGCTVEIHDSMFWNNTNSGVIVLLSATASIRRTEFAENNCSDSGGAFAIYESTLIVENSTFYRNTARRFGGAIHAINYSTLNVSDSTFDQNEAVYGGVINVKTQCKVRLSNSVITSNRGQFGGVMLMRVGSTLSIENSTLEGNTAIYGGVLYEIYSTITIKHSTFYNNTSSDHGGVMAGNHAGGSNITLSNNAFLSNMPEHTVEL